VLGGLRFEADHGVGVVLKLLQHVTHASHYAKTLVAMQDHAPCSVSHHDCDHDLRDGLASRHESRLKSSLRDIRPGLPRRHRKA
jgi:hypothetical protein